MNTPEDLTEKWKARKLEKGSYYVILTNGHIDIAKLSKYSRFYQLSYSLEVERILAPVPSYEEYLESEAHCAIYSDENKRLKEENKKLRLLLKECSSYLYENDLNDDLQFKIDSTIGESDE